MNIYYLFYSLNNLYTLKYGMLIETLRAKNMLLFSDLDISEKLGHMAWSLVISHRMGVFVQSEYITHSWLIVHVVFL